MTEHPDLLSQALEHLRYAHRREQDALAELLRTGGDRVAVQAGTGCMTGDAMLPTSEGLLRFDQLLAGRPKRENPVDVWVHGGQAAAQASTAWRPGVQRTRQLRLRGGHHAQVSDRHRVVTLTPEGKRTWRRVVNLAPGDRVALVPGTEMWGSAVDIAFSPTLAANGHRFTYPDKIDRVVGQLLGAMVADGDCNGNRIRISNARVTDWIVSLGEQVWGYRNPTCRPMDLGSTAIEFNGRGLVQWTEFLGMRWDGKAAGKVVPEAVARAPREVVLGFLEGLFLDSIITPGGKFRFSTASEKVADFVAAALLNLGVFCTRRTVVDTIAESAKHHPSGPSHQVWIEGVAELAALGAQMTFYKPEVAARYAALPERGRHSNLDVLPVPRLLDRVATENGLGRAWCRHSRAVPGAGISREKAARVLQEVSGPASDVLRELAADRTVWLSVVDVQDAGEVETFDLTVPGNQAYVANGMINHNTGKSLAALTQATAMGRPGRPSVVVTMTLALTAQYAYKDAPAVAEAIGMTYTRVVGRSHYLCASSEAGGFGAEPPEDDARAIEAWITARDEWLDAQASPHLPECSRWELDRENGLHDESYACRGSCGGKRYGGCGARRARERGAQVDVIVTNAHCLVYHYRYPFAEILPENLAYVLVDEAHQLPDTVSATLAAEIGPGFGRVWIGSENSPAVTFEVPADVAHAHGVARDGCSACEHDHEHHIGVSIHEVGQRFIDHVQAVRKEMCSAVQWTGTWMPEVRVRASAAQCQRIRDAAAQYRRWVAAILAEQWGAALPARTDDDPEPEESPGVLDTAELLALTAGMDHVVASIQRDDPEIIHLTRTKVAQATARYLGTPAALVTGTMPRTLPARVGWPDVEPGDVGHPFDYTASVKGWISRHSGVKTPPRRVTGPARAQWLDGLEDNYAARADELDRFLGDGRGLVLVPSHADAEVLRRHLVPRLTERGVPVFIQPRTGGSRRAREQVQAFIEADGPAVLIGTDSLATGVDLPGDLLTRVAWWCLPKGFTSPADEQREALYPGYRDDRLRIKVAQGIGRLLRRETDTGWVLLCDARFAQHIATANGILDRHLREIVWKRLPIRPPVESVA